MKKISLTFIFVIYLTACSPQTFSSSTPTLTSTPKQTFTPLPTITPTSTTIPTATLPPSQLTYKIDDGVSNEDIQIIQDGIDVARVYIRDFLGGDISLEQQELVLVEIVSTGLGNPSPGAGGACCTALGKTGAHLFFDINHPEWIGTGSAIRDWSDRADFMAIAAHEYAHAWQHSLGCLTINNQPLGDWMNEGIAAYVSYNAMINHGDMLPEKVKTFQIELAEYTGEISIPLETLSKTGSPVWPGNIGYLAIDYLLTITQSSPVSLRVVCEQVGDGISVNDAFKNAFGISKKDFYIEFQQYIDSIYIPTPQPSLSTGISGKLILSGSFSNIVLKEYNLTFCEATDNGKCFGVPPFESNELFWPLDPGNYRISLNPINGGDAIGWYSEKGLVNDYECADIIQVKENEIIKIDFIFDTVFSCP